MRHRAGSPNARRPARRTNPTPGSAPQRQRQADLRTPATERTRRDVVSRHLERRLECALCASAAPARRYEAAD
jgi:hypothetical protein